MRKHKLKIALSLFLLTIFLVMYHNVPKKVSADDEASLTELFGSKRVVEEELSFEEQIAFIDRMVNILHDNYVVGISIPYYAPREPAQLIENGGGLCYDFSRTIEKYLMSNGFMTRHVAAMKFTLLRIWLSCNLRHLGNYLWIKHFHHFILLKFAMYMVCILGMGVFTNLITLSQTITLERFFIISKCLS